MCWVEVVINNPPRGFGESSGGCNWKFVIGGVIIKSLPRRLCEPHSFFQGKVEDSWLRMVAPHLPELHFTMQMSARALLD